MIENLPAPTAAGAHEVDRHDIDVFQRRVTVEGEHWILRGNDPRKMREVAYRLWRGRLSRRGPAPVARVPVTTCGHVNCVRPSHLVLEDPRREKARKLHREDGLSIRDIAEKLQASPTSVHGWLRR